MDDCFDENGPEEFYDQDREGRPRKIDDEVEAEIERLLDSDPTERDSGATWCKAPRIAEHLRCGRRERTRLNISVVNSKNRSPPVWSG